MSRGLPVTGQPRYCWLPSRWTARHHLSLILFTLLIALALPARHAAAEGPTDETIGADAAEQQPGPHLVAQSVPYVHQELDTPADFYDKGSACGSTSVVMALGYLGKLSGALGEHVPTLHPTYSFGMEPAEAGLRAYGASSRRHEWASLTDILASLDRGHLVIAGTRLTSVGHIVLIVGYEQAGDSVRLIVNDPWGNADEPGYGSQYNGAYISYAWERMGIGWSIEVLPEDPAAKQEPAARWPEGRRKAAVRNAWTDGPANKRATKRRLQVIEEQGADSLAATYARRSS